MTGNIVSSLRELADKIESLGADHPLSTVRSNVSLSVYSIKNDDQFSVLKSVRDLFPGGTEKPDTYFFDYKFSIDNMGVTVHFTGEAVGDKIEEMRPVTVYRARA